VRIGIGIPTYNGADSLPGVVKDIEDSYFPDYVESVDTLIYTNGCTDSTISICNKLEQEYNLDYIEDYERGKALAWNNIVSYFDTDIIIFLDDDVRLRNIITLAKLVELLKNNPGKKVVSGAISWKESDNYLSNLIFKVYRHFIMSSGVNITGAIYAVRNGNLPEMPHNVINEDRWLGLTLGQDKIIKDFTALAYHKIPKNLWGYIKYYSRVAAGTIQLSEEFGLEIERWSKSEKYFFKRIYSKIGKLIGSICYHHGYVDAKFSRFKK